MCVADFTTYYAKLIVHGATAGGIKILVGSRLPQIARPRKTS
jgi:hypothetical protein